MCICTIKRLPWEQYAPQPLRAMGYKSKYWQQHTKITWSVLGASSEEIAFIKQGFDIWQKHVNLQFVYIDSFQRATCRIQLDPHEGSWSYVGTDNLGISPGAPTMNLGWLNVDMARGDYATVLHEIGHLIGLGHEHQNPNEPFNWDENAVIKALSGPPNNWSISQINMNVLNQKAVDEVDATVLDRDSIMIYFFPDNWTRDGKGSKQNKVLSALDIQFISTIYPPVEIFDEDAEKFDLYDFLQALFYVGRKIDYLDRSQLIFLLTKLSVPHDPKARTSRLRYHLKEILHRKK